MCLSIFLAQVIGTFVFLTSLAMLVHPQQSKKVIHDFLGTNTMVAFSGNLGLLLGLLIVISHNIWISEWPVLITLIGWIVLLQAVMRIFFPEAFVKTMKDLMSKTGYTLVCWVCLIVGVYLMWAGFSLNY